MRARPDPTPRLTLERDYLDEHPAWRARLRHEAIGPIVLRSYGALLRAMPIAPTCEPFAADRLFRPAGHHRSYYLNPTARLDPVRGPAATTVIARLTGGVLAFKGMEPLLHDFPGLLDRMQRQRREGGSVAEHFALAENKIPGALSLQEAENEGRLAAEAQTRHIAAYGALGHFPLPVALLRHGRPIGQRLLQALRQRVSGRAQERIEPLVARGIAVLVYYYPATPLRVSQLGAAFPVAPLARRLHALEEHLGRRLDADRLIGSWSRTFVRLHQLGLLPFALGSNRTGGCCDPNNAVLDGGFADLDSLIDVSEIHEEGELLETIHLGFNALVSSVSTLLLGAQADTRPSVVQRCIRHHLGARIARMMRSEKRAGRRPDSRVESYFGERLSFGVLSKILG